MTSRITTKISRDTLRLLRLIAAATGERLFAVVDRIVREEWARVQPTVTADPPDVSPRQSEQ